VELRGIDEKNSVVIFRRTVPIIVVEEKKSLPSAGWSAIVMSVMAVFAFLKRKKHL
jgi:hypothetical protein